MNLTQKISVAKQDYLNQQTAEIAERYKSATVDERAAVLKQIDSLLPVLEGEQKVFWMKLRARLVAIDEPKFCLGRIFMTPGAIESLDEAGELPTGFLDRHQKGDWGNVDANDAEENELSLKEGFRILSSYRTKADVKIWVITEADRSSTTILLPEEY